MPLGAVIVEIKRNYIGKANQPSKVKLNVKVRSDGGVFTDAVLSLLDVYDKAPILLQRFAEQEKLYGWIRYFKWD
jgi:hypothetical protein